MTDPTYVLTLTCPDRAGIVHAVAALLVEQRGYIVESQQFSDLAEDRFFMRVRFAVDGAGPATLERLRTSFTPVAERWGMTWELWDASEPYRTLILVSKYSHCLNDLLFRWSSGSLQIDVVGVLSNHPDCERLVASYGVPFHHVPVTPDTKADAEKRMLELVEAEGRRPGRARALHAGAVRRHLPRAGRQGDQHPPLVPAELQGRAALPPGVRPRREAGRRDGALRDRRPRRGPDHRAGRDARRPPLRRRRRSPRPAATSRARCSRAPCAGTPSPGCCSTGRRRSCSGSDWPGATARRFPGDPGKLAHPQRCNVGDEPVSPGMYDDPRS